jgi:predicted nucleic acid-binding protein
MPGYSSPILLDATVVSNFASSGSILFLVRLRESTVVTPAVRDEITQGFQLGHEYLESAIDAFDDTLPARGVPQDELLAELRERLDAGEAESLRGAIERDGTIATDDLAARRIAKDRDQPVIGSIGLLVLGIQRGSIDRKTADRWLDIWRNERGYYAPVDSVNDVLDTEE